MSDRCPKCKARSGDDWEQCGGSCPMPGSPHYDQGDYPLPPISLDGPHKPNDHRIWLARQLLDSKLDDATAFGIVCYSPAVSDIWKAKVAT